MQGECKQLKTRSDLVLGLASCLYMQFCLPSQLVGGGRDGGRGGLDYRSRPHFIFSFWKLFVTQDGKKAVKKDVPLL